MTHLIYPNSTITHFETKKKAVAFTIDDVFCGADNPNGSMLEEVRELLSNGLDINRLHYFGLEYRYIGEYLSNKIDYDLLVTKLNTAINRFSKRQMTFFRRMEKRGIKINWVTLDELAKLTNQINKFLLK